MTIVVHANDCKAIQCNPIAQQSAKIVATWPLQRNTIARLVSQLHDVNRDRDAALRCPGSAGRCPTFSERKPHCLRRDKSSSRRVRFEAIVARFPTENLL